MSSLHFHPLRVAASSPTATRRVIVSFDVPAELRDVFRFEPGQYLTLRTTVDGQDLRRSYSICAALDEATARRRAPGARAVPSRTGCTNDCGPATRST